MFSRTVLSRDLNRGYENPDQGAVSIGGNIPTCSSTRLFPAE